MLIFLEAYNFYEHNGIFSVLGRTDLKIYVKH